MDCSKRTSLVQCGPSLPSTVDQYKQVQSLPMGQMDNSSGNPPAPKLGSIVTLDYLQQYARLKGVD